MTLENSGLGEYSYRHWGPGINLLVLEERSQPEEKPFYFCILLNKANVGLYGAHRNKNTQATDIITPLLIVLIEEGL